MGRQYCPRCGFPKVHGATLAPQRAPRSALLLSASGVATFGLSWAVLLLFWLHGDYRPRPGYTCDTCGYEWTAGAHGPAAPA